MAYDSPGGYQSGVWLVADDQGHGLFVDKNHLPPVKHGYKYYWLGANPQQAWPRVYNAIGKLNVSVDQLPDQTKFNGYWSEVATHGYANLNFDSLSPLYPFLNPKKYNQALHGAANTAQQATQAVAGGIADIAKFIFSLQFLYVLGGFALLIVAIALIAKKIK